MQVSPFDYNILLLADDCDVRSLVGDTEIFNFHMHRNYEITSHAKVNIALPDMQYSCNSTIAL